MIQSASFRRLGEALALLLSTIGTSPASFGAPVSAPRADSHSVQAQRIFPSSAVSAPGVSPWDAQLRPPFRPPLETVQVNVDALGRNILGDGANEPSITVDPTNPRRMVVGWRQFDSVLSDFRQAGYAYSRDGGYHWHFAGAIRPGEFGSDPVLDVDLHGTFYYLTINLESLQVFRSVDGGRSWEPDPAIFPDFVDKPWMAVDRTDGVGTGNVYVYATMGAFFRSLDGGRSFDTRVWATAGFAPTVSVAPSGDVYVAGGAGMGSVGVSRSSNARDPTAIPTFELTAVLRYRGCRVSLPSPNPGGLLAQTWIAAVNVPGLDIEGVYLFTSCQREETVDGMTLDFRRSLDHGSTWSVPIRVNDDASTRFTWQWFPTMSVAPNGRIDVTWYDTRNDPSTERDEYSEVFYSFSEDGGLNWSPNVPVSMPFNHYLGGPSGNRKLGDYYTMVSDNLGVNVAYAATFNGEQDVYFLRIGPFDCNGNEVPDEDDIAAGTSLDCNANAIPDDCELPLDTDGDSWIDLFDAAMFFNCVGPLDAATDPCCARLDTDHDAAVTVNDFPTFRQAFVDD